MQTVLTLTATFGGGAVSTVIPAWTDTAPGPVANRRYTVQRRVIGHRAWTTIANVYGTQTYTDSPTDGNYDYRVKSVLSGVYSPIVSVIVPPETIQGNDPILPPPFFVDNYEMQGHPPPPLATPPGSPKRLSWTAPGLVIAQDILQEGPSIIKLSLLSYTGRATTAAQTGTTVTLSGGTFRFVAGQSEGERIVWDVGEGAEATVQTVLSPTAATVGVSQSIGAAPFNVFPPNTTFAVWSLTGAPANPADGNAIDTDFLEHPTATFTDHKVPSYFTVDTDRFGDNWPPSDHTVYFEVKATSGPVTIVSNITSAVVGPP